MLLAGKEGRKEGSRDDLYEPLSAAVRATDASQTLVVVIPRVSWYVPQNGYYSSNIRGTLLGVIFGGKR